MSKRITAVAGNIEVSHLTDQVILQHFLSGNKPCADI